jgi:hypothetical protein
MDPVRRMQLEPNDVVESGKIAGTQKHFPRPDPEHVAARPAGMIHADEMDSIPIAVSQADEAG